MRRKNIKRKKVTYPLSNKIIMIVFASIFISTLLIGWLGYSASKIEMVSNLKESLEKIALTTSLFISGDMHQNITSANSDAYYNIRLLLSEVKDAHDLEVPLYTLKRSEEKGKVEYVVTTEEDIDLLGTRYKIHPEMLTAFRKGAATSTNIYTTKNGAWISAYAPIKNSAGATVALLKVQRDAEYMREVLHTQLLWIIFFCSIAFATGSLSSVFLVRQITTNLERLNNAAASLESGDYETKIISRSNDEIGQLAQTLDKMRSSLNDKIGKLKDAWLQEKSAHLESILALSKAIEIRDPYARGHIERVSQYSVLIAKKMRVNDIGIEELKYGCILHDLGKLGINIDILEKPTILTAEEKAQIEKHPIYGAEIIKDIKFLEIARKIILFHHERYDGRGYPYGLKGEKIPLFAKIVSLADAFDAMISDRPYRKKFSVQKAFSIINSEAGKQFDPQVCYVFLELKNEVLNIRDRYKDEDRQDRKGGA